MAFLKPGPVLAVPSYMHIPALIVSLLLSLMADGDRQRPPRPPREAVEACEDLEAGEECAFEGRDQETVTGTCFTPDQDKPLACRPDDAPEPPPRDR